MLHYCSELEKNNNRTWFHENHKEYELAKADFEELINLIKLRMVEDSPELGNMILFVPAKTLMYRIPKDMRNHPNELPYTPSFRARFAQDKWSPTPVPYFLRIARGASIIGTGVYFWENKEIQKVRRYIEANADEWLELVFSLPSPIQGQTLTRIPKGFSIDSPVAPWLKHKSWFLMEELPDEILTDFEPFTEELSKRIREMEPFRQFLDRAARFALKPEAEEEF